VDDYKNPPWLKGASSTPGGGGTVLTPGGAAIKARPVKGF
jgi:hypothetical protein